MGIFGSQIKLKDAKVSGGGVYYTAGEYSDVEIECVKLQKSRKGETYLLIETLIHESSGADARGAGTRCNIMWDLGNDATPGNIKGLLVALAGLDMNNNKDSKQIESEDWDAVAEAAVSDDNPLKGERVAFEAYYRQSKKGTQYTRFNFRPSKKGQN